MSDMELMAVIGGFLLGFWVIWNLIGRQGSTKNAEHPRPESTGDFREKSSHNSFEEAQRGEDAEHRRKQEEWRQRQADENLVADDVSSRWHEILDVPPAAPMDQITKAYKRKISQYHPDKVAGLGPELQALATDKAKEINTAYQYAQSIKS